MRTGSLECAFLIFRQPLVLGSWHTIRKTCSLNTVLVLSLMTYRAENPLVNEVLTSWNRTGDYEYLQSYFIERVLGIVSRLGNKAAIGKEFS